MSRKLVEETLKQADKWLGSELYDTLKQVCDVLEEAKMFLEREMSPEFLSTEREAIDHGTPDAMMKLSAMLKFGDGVEKDETEADIWYRRGKARALASCFPDSAY